ncbi:MAG: NAD(P)H-hydrate dehydratase [Opitutaceae bacterium]|nr:NAD(P)H-hydrate dehydratase [Verrucomicrobiales bacterium]
MPIPLVSVSEMRRWEAITWATGQTEASVIDRVGAAVATHLIRLTRPDARVLILAGRGNNGADARAAARHLEPFREVITLNVEAPKQAMGSLKKKLAAIQPGRDWIVDGLFGTGLNRPLDQDWRKLMELINRCNAPIAAIDEPSGLNADTGKPWGAALRAAVTLTVGAPKIGLVTTAAAEWVGRLEVLGNVGLTGPFPRVKSRMEWVIPRDFAGFPPRRTAASHKGSYGHVVIAAGSLGYHGAAVLSARGALRARPGLVTVVTDQAVYTPVASQVQAAMVHPWNEDWVVPESCTAIVAGPGLASSTLAPGLQDQIVFWWTNSPLPMLVDASALDWLPRGRIKSKALRVMTPHPGEAARLLGRPSAMVQRDRPSAVSALSRRFGGSLVVLKGHQTVIGPRLKRLLVNGSGNPGLAQGGSGDLLAGYLGGLLAQPQMQIDPLQTVAYGVWRHGAAADFLDRRGLAWTVEDLSVALGEQDGVLDS